MCSKMTVYIIIVVRSRCQICSSVLPNYHTTKNSPWMHQRSGYAEVSGGYKNTAVISKLLDDTHFHSPACFPPTPHAQVRCLTSDSALSLALFVITCSFFPSAEPISLGNSDQDSKTQLKQSMSTPNHI